MSWPRLAAVLLALSLHAGILYAIVGARSSDNTMALSEGNGSDILTVVATVDLDANSLINQAQQDASAYVAPKQQAQDDPPKKDEPKEEVKPEEALEQQKPEETVKETDKTPPPEEKKPEKQDRVNQQASDFAKAQEQQIALAAVAAHKSRLWSQYEANLHSAFERAKKFQSGGQAGDVLLSITIAPNGQLMHKEIIKSSGKPELDRLALASVERAAPFPPIPSEVSAEPLTLNVPFQYR
jgi:periplasmic protein TonB